MPGASAARSAARARGRRRGAPSRDGTRPTVTRCSTATGASARARSTWSSGAGRRSCSARSRRAASTAFGAPVEAVTYAKQRRLRGLASRWLAAHDARAARSALRRRVRDASTARHAPAIEVIEAAF